MKTENLNEGNIKITPLANEVLGEIGQLIKKKLAEDNENKLKEADPFEHWLKYEGFGKLGGN